MQFVLTALLPRRNWVLQLIIAGAARSDYSNEKYTSPSGLEREEFLLGSVQKKAPGKFHETFFFRESIRKRGLVTQCAGVA